MRTSTILKESSVIVLDKIAKSIFATSRGEAMDKIIDSWLQTETGKSVMSSLVIREDIWKVKDGNGRR